MGIGRWLALAPACAVACLPEVPRLDYGTDTDTTGASTTLDPASSASSPPSTSQPTDPTVTTTMTTTPATMTTTPDTDDTTESTSSSSSTSSDETAASSDTTGAPPDDFGPCSPLADPLSHESDADGHRVDNDQIAIAFTFDDNGMLSGLQDPAEGIQLLFTGDVEERITGIGYFQGVGPPPETEYSWRGTDATVDVLEDGPAVVRLSVDWDTDDASTVAALDGVTEYTIIPDGRVVRHDAFTLSHSDTPQSTVWLTAYAALDVDHFDRVLGTINENCANRIGPNECPVGDAPIAAGGSALGYAPGDADSWFCAYDTVSGRSATWVVDNETVDGELTTGGRVTEYHPDAGSHTLALQYDWFRESTPPDGEYSAAAMMFVNVMHAEEDSPCDCSARHGNAYGSPPTFGTNATDVVFQPTGGYFDVIDAGASLTITLASGNEPPTLLFRLDGPTAVTSVVHEGNTLHSGFGYLTQPGTDNASAWLYVARPLAVGDTLEIEAR